jgi:hypothetical protein
MVGLFQRINFFKGLFMKTKDWQAEQQYHMEKQRFHNKFLHTPGVLPDCLGGLRVSVSDTGDTLTVAPGYAIDGEGRDLYVHEPREIPVPDLQTFNPPCTIYIVIRYTESLQDHRENTANPMYTGYAYVAEDTIIEITDKKPDNFLNIELAHVRLSENATRLYNSASSGEAGTGALPVPLKPRAGAGKSIIPKGARAGRRGGADTILPPGLDELDMTRVRQAGAAFRKEAARLSISDLGEKLIDTKVVVIAGNRKQEDTNILIEQYPKHVTAPMYMVFVHSLDGVRTRWSIECTENDEGTLDYTLHVRNESANTTTIVCRVYRVRV